MDDKLAEEKQLLKSIAENFSYQAGFNGRLSKYRWQFVLSNLPTNRAAAIDIGFGEGYHLASLCSNFGSVVALEPAKPFFNTVNNSINFSNLELKNQLFEEYQAEKKFDCVLILGVLEHVQSPISLLSKARQLLQPGGVLIATVPNANSVHRQLGVKMGLIKSLDELGELDFQVGHRRYYDPRMLTDHAIKAGFTGVSTTGIMLKFLPNSLMNSIPDEICDGLFSLGMDYPEMAAEIGLILKN